MGTTSAVKKAVISSTFATGIVLTAPLVVDAALGDQPLKKGMSHPDVKELQEVLKNKGYFNYHTATGYYGTITEEAVKQFQKTHGIQTTGIANTNTLNLLLNSTTQFSAPKTKVASATTTTTSSVLAQTTGLVRAGSQGQAVTELQQLLKAAGHFKHEVTGYYGRITQSAVQEYQKKNRLTVDGIAGRQTIAHLLDTSGGQQPTDPKAPASTQNEPSRSSTVSTQTPTATSSNQNVNNNQPIGNVQLPARVLRVGSSGTQVKELQESLKRLGHFNHEVTGYFGSITEVAVLSFQQSQRLTVDGIAGSQTFRALEQAVNTSQPTTANTSTNTSTSNNTPANNNTTATQPAPTQSNTGTTTSNTTVPARTVEQPKQTAQQPASTQTPAQQTQQGFQVMNLLADAAELVGTPYLWGGTTPSGFDCSGFVQYVFKQQEMNVPRTVAQQWSAGTSVDKPSVGDLVFFETIAKGPSHNGIYIGNNQFIHSGSSTGVIVASMNNSYWAPRYLGAKKIH
ncbi:peptidoglycan-binding protein [Alkalihalobacillus sp. BA299]|uniref:C40 family peptidase n=1 Tax=Alkalihalobacillus sp. BA299 TaxID=2815938 RepID=UPI001ADA1C35|nr:peptidoglycan-binding protein [Alkalihalobacillus sp. BA299]